MSSFERTGINPIGRDFLSVPRPGSKDAPSTMVSVEALATLLQVNRGSIRSSVDLQVPV